MAYSAQEISLILKNDNMIENLIEYCKYLADEYNKTNEGKYRIKYNDLYPILYHSLSENKKEEFFNSFVTSLEINPITKIKKNKILLQTF